MDYRDTNRYKVSHEVDILLNRSYISIDDQVTSFSVILNSLYIWLVDFLNAHFGSIFQYILNLRFNGSYRILATVIYYFPSLTVLHFTNNHNTVQQR